MNIWCFLGCLIGLLVFAIMIIACIRGLKKYNDITDKIFNEQLKKEEK